MNFQNILSWITGIDGGAFIIVSAALSWALEDMKKWQELTSKVRSLIILGVAVVLGIATVALQSNPALVAALEPYAQVVIYIILAWLATQAAHKVNPVRSENAWKEMAEETVDDLTDAVEETKYTAEG